MQFVYKRPTYLLTSNNAGSFHSRHCNSNSARGSGIESPVTPPIAVRGSSRNNLANNIHEDIELDISFRGHDGQPEDTRHFRKRREKSARILITIVLTFVFCHTFRLVIKAYEVTHPSHSTSEHHVLCLEQGRSVGRVV
jgi:hypothetical protein